MQKLIQILSHAVWLYVCIHVISKTEVITIKLQILPVQREAEVVALLHATAHHRHHGFLHARWCKLHCVTTNVSLASSNEEVGFVLIQHFL